MTSGIIEILTENATVQTIVGRNAANTKYKIYPVVVPEKEDKEFVTVFKGSNDPLNSLSKDLVSELDYPRVTVTCWAKSFRKSELMFEAVRLALDNVSSVTDAGYSFNRIWLVDDRDGFDNDSQLYCHVCVFAVELKRFASDVLESLINNSAVLWGGLWNWTDNSNALPTDVKSGKMWITEDDYSVGGVFIPAGTAMIALNDNANDFGDFNFNV